ncbi:MAG: squalene synthase HpnC [Alphaproteobacteria bacterium]|nr:squalene synthase HpnC [Alphaproteobacteria bacterium]
MTANTSLETPTKTSNDENFPVASWLIPAELREHVHIFYLCVRAGDDVADSPDLEPEEKSALLKRMDDALQGNGTVDEVTQNASNHALSAAETDVTTQHARHLLQAFTMDVTKKRYRNWSELVNYCLYSAAPVGRYLVDLHGCDDRPKKATDALCIALQILNHLQDCKDDYLEIDRVYIPEDMLRAQKIDVTALKADCASAELRAVLDAVLDRTDELLQHARTGPKQISHRGLRLETAVIVAIAEKLSKKLRRNDPIAGRVELTKIQKASCALKGLWRGMVTA